MKAKAMVEILKLTKTKRSKKILVETSIGEYKLSEDTIVNFLVLKGKTFTIDEFNKIIDSEKSNDLFNKVLNYISYQMRSEYEIEKYLLDKDASSEDVGLIIEKLKKFGYLNDEELANYVFDSVLRNQKGPKVLENKLQEKRIDNLIIKEYLNKYNYSLEYEVASEVIEKEKNKNNDEPIKKQKQSIYNKLLRYGFSSNIINNIVSELKLVDNSSEKLEKEIEKLLYKYRSLEKKELKQKMIKSLISKGYEYSEIIDKISE